MTREDLSLFTSPKAIFYKYQRQLVYNITSHQMKLFNNVVEFDKDIKTLLDKKKALIVFLDQNPRYHDTSYINIWFKLAHSFYITKRKVFICNTNFIRYSRNNEELTMSFINNDTNDDIGRMPSIDKEFSDDSNDDSIQELDYNFKKLSIK